MVAGYANGWSRVVVCLAAGLVPLLFAGQAVAQPITPFAPRFSTTDTGEIVLVANTVVQPDPNDAGAANARNGLGTRLNNNDFTMLNVDVDSDGSTFNSSTADLNLPNGATVLFAGLYWGADSNSAQRHQVRVATPASSAYTTITGLVLGAAGGDYQAFADVTPLVQAAGNGTYTVANVQATVNSSDRHGGWTLVIAYRAPGLPAKDLTVFDGFARVANSSGANNVSVTITGFTAPPTGAVNAAISVVAYEGDRGSTGDSLRLNGTALSDPSNPPTNFFNSSISTLGTDVATKNPHQINQLGFDAITIGTSNLIPNGATSATISLTTGGETYFPGVVATAIDLFSPEIDSAKSFTDLNGGDIVNGDVIEYAITLANNGQDAAGNLVFVDAIPANTTYTPGSLQIVSGANAGAKSDVAGDDQAEFDAGNNRVLFRLGSGANAAAGGTLAIGDTATLRFRVSVNGDTPNRTVIDNQGTTSFTGQTTGFSLSAQTNESSFTVDAQSDLQLAKAVDNPTPNVGDTIAFTLSVSNLGPSPATSVVVQDSLPAGLSFVSASASHGDYSSASSAWTVGTLASGATAQLVLHAIVTAPAAINTATAASAVQDPNPANNTASAVLTVQEADLVLTKTISSATPDVGDLITYTLTLTNNGPLGATNVQVSDPLDWPFQFAVPGQGTYDSVSGIWSVGTLASGDTATLALSVVVNSVVPRTNAAVASADQFDPDATNNSASVVATPRRADLVLTKSVSNLTPNVGDPISYTIALTNLGPDTATGIAAVDAFPAGVTFGSALLSQGTYTPATGAWTVGTLADGGVATLTLSGVVNSPNPSLNTIAVSAVDQFDPVAGNNNATASFAPAQADLSLTKTVSDAAPNVGDIITFTLTLTNNGPDAVPSALVSDAVPAGLSLLSTTTTQGSYVPASALWNIGAMPNGATSTLTMTMRVDSPAPSNNVAVASAGLFDPDPADNMANVVVAPQSVDLAITKSVSNPAPSVGNTVTFTVQVTNAGQTTATNVTVQDLLPAGLALVDATPTPGTYDPGTGGWLIGTLAAGATATLTIDATVIAAASATNFATVRADQFDLDPGNDSADAAIAAPSAGAGVDVAVAITAAPASTVTGDIVTLIVVATNNGPGNATSLVVDVPLPGELSVEGATVTAGTFDATTLQWTIGALATGSAVTLRLSARATTAFSLDVIATRTALAETDSNAANDSASVHVLARNWSTFLADLVLDGATTSSTVAPGGLLGYNLTAVNRGPTYVVDLSIGGDVPSGTTFASATPSAGATCTTPPVGATGAVVCTWPGVTMLDTGAKRTLAITVRADSGAAAGTTVTGHFLASSLTGEYYDPSNQVTMTASVAGGATADLAVTAIMQSDGVQGTALAVPLGVPTPLRFTVRNLGPTATVDARYAIDVPDVDIAGLSILGASVTQGAVGLTGVASAEWQIGALAAGATATFDLSVAMRSMRATTITIRRVESLPGDPANANDRATLSLDGTGDPNGGERWSAIGNIDGVGLKEVIVGAGRLETPQVRIFGGDGSDTGLHFYAYNRNFVGGVRVATCDVDDDGIDEIVTAPGIGPGPHIRVLKMQQQVVTEVVGFYAFDPDFPDGIYVACADVDNDGHADVVAAMGGGGSEVRVFDVGADRVTQKASFVAYEPAFVGGVRVAGVATNEPGGAQYQIVTVPGPGRPLELRTWTINGGSAAMTRAVPVTGTDYQLGAFVDVADLDGDGRPEAVMATDRGIPGLVGALTIDSGQFLGVFQPYPSSFLGGAHVALGDIDADGRMELLITPGTGGRPRLDAYTVTGGLLFRYQLETIELP